MEEKSEVNYFWDSYAIIELEKGNPNYLNYSSSPIIISIFNLAEIYYSFINDIDDKEADKLYEDYRSAVVEVPDDILKEAMEFKKQNKKKKLSYTDCIGYIYARQNGMRFLTGDKEFKDLENVEFVK